MEIKTTSKFRKDLKQAKKKGLNMALLQDVVDKLAAGKKTGRKDALILTLARTGTHSDLFKM